jgi:thiol-disulfide isomerase/thioredoxin
MNKIKRILMVWIGLALAGCSPVPANLAQATVPEKTMAMQETQTPASSPADSRAAYPDLGPAPELRNSVWLNTGHPLRLKDLGGKVVLLEMWTFDCINCQHVVPALRNWYAKYQSQGLVIIGNHFPEFSFERDLGNLKDAIQRLDIHYPVAQDNDGATWAAYNNEYWPTAYLIDKHGHIRYRQIGEGNYQQTESAIAALLNEPE